MSAIVLVALVTILLNGLEKLLSYRLQAGAPQIMGESNPIAKVVIRRFGLFPTHVVFFFFSVVIVCLTYVLAEFSLFASLCLWLELVGSSFVFLNNWVLERLHHAGSQLLDA